MTYTVTCPISEMSTFPFASPLFDLLLARTPHRKCPPSQVWGLSAHPKERLYATCGDDGSVRIWSLDDRRVVGSISTDCSCRALCYSPDGASLAVSIFQFSFFFPDLQVFLFPNFLISKFSNFQISKFIATGCCQVCMHSSYFDHSPSPCALLRLGWCCIRS